MSASVTVPNRANDHAAANGQWRVRDTNARTVIGGEVLGRDHEILPGISYKLFFDRDTPMPEEHARRFLVDPAFLVLAPDNTRLVPLSDQVKSRDLPPTLKPNQVIADLNELNAEALVNRCLIRPNAPKFNVRSKREAMIEFLLSSYEAEGDAGRPASTGSDDGDGELEEVEGADVDKLFGG
jgi:hypothetical protein